MDLDAFKAAQRRMWADGDYRPIGRALAPAAQILVDWAGVTEGQRMLDVAAGSGSVAVAAARAGGDASCTMMSTLTSCSPPPPAFVTPSIRWGQPSHVRQLFASYEVDVVFERPSFGIAFESVDAFESAMVDNSGGFDDLRRVLDDIGCWEQAHSDFRRAVEQANEADDGSYGSRGIAC